MTVMYSTNPSLDVYPMETTREFVEQAPRIKKSLKYPLINSDTDI